MGDIRKAVVIGAGITGLACAFRLQQLGIRALILEASAKAGGVISTVRRNGFLFEGGPQFPRFPESVWTLIRDIGIEDQFVAGNSRAKRYILRNGELHRAPFSAGELITTSLIGLHSKYRLLSEVFRHSHPPVREESLAEFVDRKFGAEVLDYLVDPFISTIFFGDSRKMGMQSAFPALVEWEQSRGSVVRGALSAYRNKQNANPKSAVAATPAADSTLKHRDLHVTDALPSLGSFKGGMGTLVEGLAQKLKEELQFGVKVQSVATLNGANEATPGWRIRLSSGDEINAGAVVLATPSYAAVPMLIESAPKLSALLAGIEHAPMNVVSSAFDRKQVRHTLEGFGFMVPRRERMHTICTFWNSSLFPSHARNATVVLTSFAVRGSDANQPDELLPQQVEAENAAVLNITGAPIDRMVWKYPRALPQYNVGHTQRVKEIRKALNELPGLFLAGNYLTGRSIGDCVESGFQAADQLHSRSRD
ncbi:MAG TPA: protoporphyrinogen oxidase [Candidatus Acidoferrum sp.]|nr:protoporphyrinogen oxidase [Candidatus Acidoferrum sp.]